MKTETRSNRLRKIGFLTKAMALILGGITFIIGFVFPPLWIASFLLIGLSVGYRAAGRCPVCESYIEVNKKRGGVKCGSCGSFLLIKDGRLYDLR